MIAVLMMLVAATPEGTAALHRFLPCTPALTIEYEIEGERAKTVRMIDVVRGPGKVRNTCIIERTTTRPGSDTSKETLMREMLPDRILNAGWADQPVAFRPPLIKLPLSKGAKWRFNTTEFELREVAATVEVPAGKFEGCARVAERTRDGAHEAVSTFAPDVGLVLYETRDLRQRAVRVTSAHTTKTKQESPKTSR